MVNCGKVVENYVEKVVSDCGKLFYVVENFLDGSVFGAFIYETPYNQQKNTTHKTKLTQTNKKQRTNTKQNSTNT